MIVYGPTTDISTIASLIANGMGAGLQGLPAITGLTSSIGRQAEAAKGIPPVIVWTPMDETVEPPIQQEGPLTSGGGLLTHVCHNIHLVATVSLWAADFLSLEYMRKAFIAQLYTQIGKRGYEMGKGVYPRDNDAIFSTGAVVRYPVTLRIPVYDAVRTSVHLTQAQMTDLLEDPLGNNSEQCNPP